MRSNAPKTMIRNTTHVWFLIFCFILGAVYGVGMPSAQAQSMELQPGGTGLPLTINATGGIEWNQQEKMFIAAGPARATRGDMILDADELRAYYRESHTGGRSELFRLDAIGNVRITTPGRVATGGRAIYDIDASVMILKNGTPVKLTSGADVITTTGQLEFWDKRDLAVARGGALVIHLDKRIQADIITAHFIPGTDGKKQIGRVEAFDNVRIDTANERIFANRVAYNVPTGLARLTGSVKIKRGNNEINGCSADIDLNTGISRLNKCAKTGAKTTGQSGRVHGVLAPKKTR